MKNRVLKSFKDYQEYIELLLQLECKTCHRHTLKLLESCLIIFVLNCFNSHSKLNIKIINYISVMLIRTYKSERNLDKLTVYDITSLIYLRYNTYNLYNAD
jgi:hypothetical protein